MGLFYAYAKHVSDETTYRYLIVFASRAVADEWWRVVSTTSNTQVAGSISRVTPQLYTHNFPAKVNIADTILTTSVASQFSTKILFDLQSNRDTAYPFAVAPPVHITDHLSGDWFYIRTTGPNPVYWYYSQRNKVIVASRTNSTRFRITAVDDKVKPGMVMIGSDLVEISFKAGKVRVADNGSLERADQAEQLKFGNFFEKDGYKVNGYGKVEVAGLPENGIVRTDKDDADGQEWELSSEGIIGGGSDD